MKAMKCIWMVAALVSWATIDNLNTLFWVSFTVLMVLGFVLADKLDRKEMEHEGI